MNREEESDSEARRDIVSFSAEPRCSVSKSDSDRQAPSDGSSSSSSSEEETTSPPNKRPRRAHGEPYSQFAYDPRVDALLSQVGYLTSFVMQASGNSYGCSTSKQPDSEREEFVVPPKQKPKTVDLGEVNTEIKSSDLLVQADPGRLTALNKLHQFNSPAWQAVRYKKSLKSVLATPGFTELKINGELMHFKKGKDYLASTEQVMAGLTNAVLMQREILKESLQQLVDWSSENEVNAITLCEKVTSLFGSGSASHKNSELTLQILAGKRIECVEIRRNYILSEITNVNLKESLKAIPPSNEYLFSREALAPLIQSLGGTQMWLNTPTYLKEKRAPAGQQVNKQSERQMTQYDKNRKSQTSSNDFNAKFDKKFTGKKRGTKQQKTFRSNNASSKK